MLAASSRVGDVINLNRWRKAARRRAEAAAADENAARHGRTKSERTRVLETERREAERHDAHRLATPADEVREGTACEDDEPAT